jgi:hypothetical protein
MRDSISDHRDRIRGAATTLRQEGRKFAAGRVAALDRLVRAGIPRRMAEAWIEMWDVSTAELYDFRSAPDFWAVGYRYAVEEYKRGYKPRWWRDTASDETDASL